MNDISPDAGKVKKIPKEKRKIGKRVVSFNFVSLFKGLKALYFRIHVTRASGSGTHNPLDKIKNCFFFHWV